MSQRALADYYDATAHSAVRPDLEFAISLVGDTRIAIDCGCGAGADIDYMLSQGFKVYGFDIEEESISRCQKRFHDNSSVILATAEFDTFTYPSASLVVADASLFFCKPSDFPGVWRSIYDCLHLEGIFCGSFLGPEDTMAKSDRNDGAFWLDRSVFTEDQVKNLFKGFEICRFTEHKTSGTTPQGTPHHWHIFSVVAKKSDLIS